jgi:hypothetical protein
MGFGFSRMLRPAARLLPAVDRGQERADAQLVEQRADAALQVVTDRAYCGHVEAGRVVEVPVGVPGAGEDGAGVAAAHRDDDVGGAHHLVGPRLGVLADGGELVVAGMQEPLDRLAAVDAVELGGKPGGGGGEGELLVDGQVGVLPGGFGEVGHDGSPARVGARRSMRPARSV